MKQLNSNVTLRQWEKLTIEKQDQNQYDRIEKYGNQKKKFVTKPECNSSNVFVGEVMDQLESKMCSGKPILN